MREHAWTCFQEARESAVGQSASTARGEARRKRVHAHARRAGVAGGSPCAIATGSPTSEEASRKQADRAARPYPSALILFGSPGKAVTAHAWAAHRAAVTAHATVTAHASFTAHVACPVSYPRRRAQLTGQPLLPTRGQLTGQPLLPTRPLLPTLPTLPTYVACPVRCPRRRAQLTGQPLLPTRPLLPTLGPRCPRGVPGELPEATSASHRAAVTAHATVTAHAGATRVCDGSNLRNVQKCRGLARAAAIFKWGGGARVLPWSFTRIEQ